MLKSRMLKLTAAAFAIASVVGLTGMGAQALAATAVARTAQAAKPAAGFHVYTNATKPAAAHPAANPDLLCPDPSVCVWQGTDFSGREDIFPTQPDSEMWINLVAVGGLTLPWGSFDNNSGSSVVFGDAQTNTGTCYLPHTSSPDPTARHDRYMWIEYGNTTCSGHVGDLPGDNTPPSIHIG